MADDTPDLISNISVTGGDTAAAALQDVADKGSAALDKLAKSATSASNAVAQSSDDITGSFNKISQSAPTDATATRLDNIQASAKNLGAAVRTSAIDIGTFATKLATVGGIAAAAVVGFAKFAQSITAATRPPIDNTADLTAQLEKLNKQSASNVVGAVLYDQQIQALNRQVAAGTLGYLDYNAAIKTLNQTTKDNQEAQGALQAAQRETQKQNQELEQQASRREAFNQLAETYGTVLTGSLIKLGNASLDVSHQLRDAFGPVISNLVDKFVDLINRNSDTIKKLIDSGAKALDDFINKSGPGLDAIASKITDMAKSISTVFTQVIVPTFNIFLQILDKVASAINGVFGTNIDSTGLIVIGVILALTGGFTALFSVINIGIAVFGVLSTLMGGPIAIAVVALTVLLVALYNAVDWHALGISIQSTFDTLKTKASDAITTVIGFFTSFPTNLAIVWQAILDGATALWQKLSDGFNTLVDDTINLANTIAQPFIDAWNKIKNGAQDMWNSIKGWWDDLKQKALDYLKLQSQAAAAPGGGTDGGQSFAGGGHVVGKGSWTSDSIPAWLSNHEFVIQARAVAKYGVSFMKAINSGALDIGSAIQGFASGGLVTSGLSVPRFATNSAVNKSNRILNLTIGGETFSGLQMPESVADKMSKFAVAKQVSSAGRKPSWIGGPK